MRGVFTAWSAAARMAGGEGRETLVLRAESAVVQLDTAVNKIGATWYINTTGNHKGKK
jgi:hypothetical protein